MRAAKCHLMLGNPSLALDFYQKVLSFEPHNGQALQEVRGRGANAGSLSYTLPVTPSDPRDGESSELPGKS